MHVHVETSFDLKQHQKITWIWCDKFKTAILDDYNNSALINNHVCCSEAVLSSLSSWHHVVRAVSLRQSSHKCSQKLSSDKHFLIYCYLSTYQEVVFYGNAILVCRSPYQHSGFLKCFILKMLYLVVTQKLSDGLLLSSRACCFSNAQKSFC